MANSERALRDCQWPGLTLRAPTIYKDHVMLLRSKRADQKNRLGSPRKGRPATAVARAGGEH